MTREITPRVLLAALDDARLREVLVPRAPLRPPVTLVRMLVVALAERRATLRFS